MNPPLRGAGLPGTRLGPRALLREGETPGSGLRPDHGARQHLGEVEHLGAAAAGPLAVIEHDQAIGAGDPHGVGTG